jgi:hypothetical protein
MSTLGQKRTFVVRVGLNYQFHLSDYGFSKSSAVDFAPAGLAYLSQSLITRQCSDHGGDGCNNADE